ncbi:MliC family protein [Rhizobium halophytocola]|uniref:DUF1311 domain-containing protein n=1 Tax=Rhizobium halophytocola TaxID=735519 RepID=A0ABS4DW16_9HYPH|nr:MliC family protein [Rhizobium halophytocola]MBP1849887.1 uncharacterized protein [Rhizobium halophytocola]
MVAMRNSSPLAGLAGLFAVAMLAGLVSLLQPLPAKAAKPTFPCARDGHAIEVLICGNAALAEKDRKLAEVYAQALAALKGLADEKQATRDLKTYQRGWIGGRNDCWKADDTLKCTNDSYDTRIAELQARYFLVKGGDPVFFRCDDNTEIVATFIATEPPAVRLERGDSQKIGLLAPSASGARYVADFGVSFWTKGDEAMVTWPEGSEFHCTVTTP